MGLDMYAYSKKSPESEQVEISYWRKHNALHGWMENLYRQRGGTEEFNCVELELFECDLEKLESDVKERNLSPVGGFFFGSTEYSEERWQEESKGDLEFIAKARECLSRGESVFYNSWW